MIEMSVTNSSSDKQGSIEKIPEKNLLSENNQLCGRSHNKLLSMMVWTSLYMVNAGLIGIGFYRHTWLMIIAGMYGIYETTWEFAKVYPNWFERKVILVSFYLILSVNA